MGASFGSPPSYSDGLDIGFFGGAEPGDAGCHRGFFRSVAASWPAGEPLLGLVGIANHDTMGGIPRNAAAFGVLNCIDHKAACAVGGIGLLEGPCSALP